MRKITRYKFPALMQYQEMCLEFIFYSYDSIALICSLMTIYIFQFSEQAARLSYSATTYCQLRLHHRHSATSSHGRAYCTGSTINNNEKRSSLKLTPTSCVDSNLACECIKPLISSQHLPASAMLNSDNLHSSSNLASKVLQSTLRDTYFTPWIRPTTAKLSSLVDQVQNTPMFAVFSRDALHQAAQSAQQLLDGIHFRK